MNAPIIICLNRNRATTNEHYGEAAKFQITLAAFHRCLTVHNSAGLVCEVHHRAVLTLSWHAKACKIWTEFKGISENKRSNCSNTAVDLHVLRSLHRITGVPAQPGKHGWTSDKDRTLPSRPAEASLMTGDIIERWFTVAPKRTMTLGMTRHSRRDRREIKRREARQSQPDESSVGR